MKNISGAVLILLLFQIPANAADKIRIGYPAPNVEHINPMLAQKMGFFKKEGIDAEIIRIGSPASLAALVNGDIDYYSAISPVVAAAVRGVPVRVVACYLPGAPSLLVARANIKSVKELKGKTIAVSNPGATPTLITKMIVKHFGLDPEKDTKFLPLGGDQRRLIAMKQGLVDAISLSPPFDFLAKKAGFVVLARAYELFNFPVAGLTASVKKIKERPDEVKRVIKAGLDTDRYIRRNRDGTIQFLMEWLKISKELATASYDGVWQGFSENGNLPEDGIRIIIEQAKKANKVEREVSIDNVVDTSILKEVQREAAIN